VKNNIGVTTMNNVATSDSYYVNKAGGNYRLMAGSVPINAGIDLTEDRADRYRGREQISDSST